MFLHIESISNTQISEDTVDILISQIIENTEQSSNTHLKKIQIMFQKVRLHIIYK